MLLKYIVKNYKSIAHSIEYSMFPTEDNLESKYFIPLPTVQGTWKILRRGALLGPHASGKSNFIQSLDFARDYIVEAQKSGNKTGVPQFKGEFCLHTKLTRTFINDFIAKEHKNQLIFTAHDINLISLEDLAQDEIWFLEKNKLGESYLKPFSDYTIPSDMVDGYSNVKSYLAGRFGAVPVIKGGFDK